MNTIISFRIFDESIFHLGHLMKHLGHLMKHLGYLMKHLGHLMNI